MKIPHLGIQDPKRELSPIQRSHPHSPVTQKLVAFPQNSVMTIAPAWNVFPWHLPKSTHSLIPTQEPSLWSLPGSLGTSVAFTILLIQASSRLTTSCEMLGKLPKLSAPRWPHFQAEIIKWHLVPQYSPIVGSRGVALCDVLRSVWHPVSVQHMPSIHTGWHTLQHSDRTVFWGAVEGIQKYLLCFLHQTEALAG